MKTWFFSVAHCLQVQIHHNFNGVKCPIRNYSWLTILLKYYSSWHPLVILCSAATLPKAKVFKQLPYIKHCSTNTWIHFYFFKCMLNSFKKHTHTTVLGSVKNNLCMAIVFYIPCVFSTPGEGGREKNTSECYCCCDASCQSQTLLPASYCSSQEHKEKFDPGTIWKASLMLRLEAISMWAWDCHGHGPWHIK